jgi:hypothetical protein
MVTRMAGQLSASRQQECLLHRKPPVSTLGAAGPSVY